jgi:maltooligosyltrehalose trehalohydrolase
MEPALRHAICTSEIELQTHHQNIKMRSIANRPGITRDGAYLIFRVWAPYQPSLLLEIQIGDATQCFPMQPEGSFFQVRILSAGTGLTYFYVTEAGERLADPCSRYQPQGVRGPSAFVPDTFAWGDDAWRGIPLEACILYELHVGTFTEAGTFEGIIECIDRLKQLGVTCVQLMPVAQYSGRWNWGYDGVFPFAVQDTYGGPLELKRLINALHRSEIAVALDVVYNHIGPEGCCLQAYGPYFSKSHSTPWGKCLNLDGEESLPVRDYVKQNILQWVHEFHIDVLRLDAIHNIKDHSETHLLREVARDIHALAEKLGREILLIGEANVHNPIYLKSTDGENTWGLDNVWCDDFAYAAQASFTEVQTHSKRTYHPWQDFLQILQGGVIFNGLPSEPRRVESSAGLQHPGLRHTAYLNNHDITGNEPTGKRHLNSLEDSEWQLLMALLCLMPHVPMLFMGDEYGEPNPFLYFVDHKDAQLLQLIRAGRAKEFTEQNWGQMTDPASAEAFSKSKCQSWPAANPKFRWIQSLIQIRKSWMQRGLMDVARLQVDWCEQDQTLWLGYRDEVSAAYIVAGKSAGAIEKHQNHALLQNDSAGQWNVAVCSPPVLPA